MAADSGGHKEPLQLEPFIHQVGGHSCMLQLDEDTICKPLIPQELNFYETAPECLKEFMPECKGVIEVTFSEGVDGYLDVTAHVPSTYRTASSRPVSRHNSVTENNERKMKHRIRVCHSGNILIESDSTDDMKQTFEEGNPSQVQNGCPLNPWVLRCHQEQMKKMLKMSQVISLKYLLLENRVSKYEFPCILDIKMGTRQYGDDASEKKRESHMAKVATTTSATLGIRICGMQVYHRESSRFICHNKYYGRSLTVDGFHQTLYRFLHDGTQLRQNIVSRLLEKLQKLHTVVQSLHTFRFFTSSLLVIYDGKEQYEPTMNNENNVFDVSLKKRNAVHVNENGNIGKDTKSDEKFIPKVHSQTRFCENSDMPLCSNYVVDGCTAGYTEQPLPPLVDLCTIDFAHSTQSQMPGVQIAHAGPDEGYLFGLKNLIAHLEMLQHKNNCL